MGRRTSQLLPQVSFCVLLALGLQPRHGYEIMQQVAIDSKDRVRIGPGALYTALKQLRADNLIEELSTPADSRRKQYQLTRAGRNRLDDELEYFAHALTLGQQRRIPIVQHDDVYRLEALVDG